jgi:hypothetical protein
MFWEMQTELCLHSLLEQCTKVIVPTHLAEQASCDQQAELSITYPCKSNWLGQTSDWHLLILMGNHKPSCFYRFSISENGVSSGIRYHFQWSCDHLVGSPHLRACQTADHGQQAARLGTVSASPAWRPRDRPLKSPESPASAKSGSCGRSMMCSGTWNGSNGNGYVWVGKLLTSPKHPAIGDLISLTHNHFETRGNACSSLALQSS